VSRVPQFFASRVWDEEGIAVVEGDEHVHLSRVLRLGVEKEVFVSDGRGRRWRGVIAEVGRGQTRIRLRSLLEEPEGRSLEITLIQALPKRRKMEWILQKATEMGVSRIVPVESRYCVARLRGEKRDKRYERWKAIVKAAAKQSYRSSLPALTEVMPLADALRCYRGELNIFLAPDSESSLRDRLAHHREVTKVVVVIGAEGGFHPDEKRIATEAGYLPCHLGKGVLRVETAVVKVLSILQYLYGEG